MRDRLNAKLNTDDVSKLDKQIVPQLLGWRDEVQADKRAAERIFGEQKGTG